VGEGTAPRTAGAPPEALDAALRRLVEEATGQGGEVAVVVRHLERGDRWEHGADVVFAAASTIKVPILAGLYEAAHEGVLRLADRVAVEAEDQVTGSGVLQVLSPGVELPWRDLAERMVVVSDNAATNKILRAIGTERVNRLLDRIGCPRTRVVRPLQVIPADAEGTNTVTAGEYATLFERLAEGRIVSWEACRRMVATLKRQQLNDALPALLPDPLAGRPLGAIPAWEMAHKTGGIPGYQHDGGILYLPGQTVVVVACTRGLGSGRQARGWIARVGRAVWEAYAARA
jgi:beta-lactamase class A